jgi:translocation and assembly module TamB
VKGKVKGTSKDISPFGRLFRKNIHGKTAFTLRLDATDFKQSAHLVADCTNLRAPTFHFDHVRFELEGQGQWPKPALDLTIESTKGQWKHLEFNNSTVDAALDLSQELPRLLFELKSAGKVDKGPFLIDAKGALSSEELAIDRFSLSLDTAHTKLTVPFLLKKEASTITLAPFELLWDTGAKISAHATLAHDNLEGKLEATSVPLDFIHFLFPTAFLSGNFSATGSLSGTSVEPRLHLEAGSQALTFGTKQQDLLIPIETYCSLDMDDTMAQCHGKMKTAGIETPLVMHLTVPIAIQERPLKFEFPSLETLSGHVQGSIEIAPFFSPFLLDDEIIEGIINMNVLVSGTVIRPKFGGTVSWSKGKLDLLKTGRTLSDIMVQGHFKNDELLISSCTATDEREGRVTATGKMQLSYDKGFPYVCDITTHKMDFIRRDFATICGSGQAKLTGNFEGASITGDVVIDHAGLSLSSDFVPDITSIEYTYINHPEQPKQAVSKPFILGFDLNITVPEKRCTISGRGLQSFWKGKLKISGTTEAPLVHGEIEATNGSFTFAEKEFALTQGTIECDGDLLTKSRMNIAAFRDLGDLRAKLFLRGSLDKPRLYIESAPQMTQKEILSRILFNKALADISPVEGLQLAHVIMSINTNGKNTNVIEKFKKALRIDHIDISRSESQNPGDTSDAVTVQVGKHLSKDVFVKLSKDVANATHRVAVEANLHKNVSVQAEVGDDQEGQMSLMWKYDY